MGSFNLAIRRVVPSLAKLTYNPLFKVLLNVGDWPAKALFPRLRRLPPNHLRVRVGVSNKLFTNHVSYLAERWGLWLTMALDGLWDLDSTIVEIGCGCGRAAHILRDFRFQDRVFRGRYYGIDIDEEALEWCRRNFDAERFTFMKSSHTSNTYGKGGNGSERYTIDLSDDSADLIFSTSLFSHLLEAELQNYFEESRRILRPGRSMFMSVFCMDYPPPTMGDRHSFKHRIGNAHVESLRVPEAAVAYEADFLLCLARSTGFATSKIIHHPGAWQPYLICQK